MKRFLILLILITMLPELSALQAVHAQTAPVLSAGDKVIVTSENLPVYVQPSSTGKPVAELFTAIATFIVKTQQDSTGATWVYLTDGAYGWVPASQNGVPTLTLYSDAAMQKMISDATAAIAKDPTSIDPYMARGMAYNELHKADDAIADYQAALKLQPDNGRLYEFFGDINLLAGKYDDAEMALKKAIQLKRILPSTFNRLGQTSLHEYNYDDAKQAFTQAISLAPTYGISHSNRAWVFSDEDDVDGAIKECDEAIKDDPLLAEAYSQRGSFYQQQQQIPEALQDYQTALKIDKNCADCYLDMGAFTSDVQGNLSGGLQDFNTAIAINPYISRAYSNRATTEFQLGQMDAAMQDIQQAVTLNPLDDYAQFELGTFAAYHDQYQQSIQAFTQVITFNRHYSFSSLLYRGEVYIAARQYNNAISDLDQYISNSNDADEYFLTVAHLARGVAFLYEQDYDDALIDYSAVWAKDSVVNFARSYHSQGTGFWESPDRESLIDSLNDAIAKNPADTKSMYQAATLEMEFGRWQEASDMYHKYFEATKTAMPVSLQKILTTVTAP